MTVIRQNAEWALGARKTSGPYTGGPPKLLFHATIAPSTALPGYAGQSMAPHQTLLWEPRTKVLHPFQHYYWDQFAKALVNAPGGVETNRDSALQVELAGYLGSSTPSGEFNILEAPSTYWEQVADQLGPVALSANVKNMAPADWSPSGRMSLAQWDNWSGLCAHVHVPENNHSDLNLKAEVVHLIQSKIWTSTPQVITRPPEVHVPVVTGPAPIFPYSPRNYFGMTSPDPLCHSGRFSSKDRTYIRTFQSKLVKRGWPLVIDGLFGQKTSDVIYAFQKERPNLGDDRRVGPLTWRAIWNSAII